MRGLPIQPGRPGAVTSRHRGLTQPDPGAAQTPNLPAAPSPSADAMGIDFHLIANFGALALITLAGPAVIFILFYRRGAL